LLYNFIPIALQPSFNYYSIALQLVSIAFHLLFNRFPIGFNCFPFSFPSLSNHTILSPELLELPFIAMNYLMSNQLRQYLQKEERKEKKEKFK
jgi:hypothetical protein